MGKKVYVLNTEGISVIDTATDNVTAAVSGILPFGVAFNPAGKKAYVTDGYNTVYVIDAVIDHGIGEVPIVGKNTIGGIAVTPDGSKVYVVNYDGNVSEIDTATNKVTAKIPVGVTPALIGIR
jgi:YVTN family beta-propeller protein